MRYYGESKGGPWPAPVELLHEAAEEVDDELRAEELDVAPVQVPDDDGHPVREHRAGGGRPAVLIAVSVVV